MINRVILVGRLTKDLQLRKTPNGASVVSFTLAVSRRKSKNDTSNTPDADFVPCVAWNQQADLMCQYLRKGSQIGVEGKIATRSYDDPNTPNKKVYVTEVVCDNVTFLESKSASENRSANAGTQYNNNNYSSYYPDDSYNDMASTPALNISSDDLPF